MCVSCNAIHRLSMGGCECKCSSGVCAHEEHVWTDEHIGYIGFVVVVKNQLHRPCLPFQNIDPKTLVWSSSWRVPSLHGGTPPSPHKHCPTHAPNSHTNPLSASNHQSICKKQHRFNVVVLTRPLGLFAIGFFPTLALAQLKIWPLSQKPF